MQAWATDMIGVFLGAFLGALFGYAANVWYQRKDSQASRDALFFVLTDTLTDQLESISADMAADDAIELVSWPPLHVSAASQLLAGDKLHGKKYVDLIKAIVAWESWEIVYNEQVRLVNHAQLTGNLPRSVSVARHNRMLELVDKLKMCRMEILRELPEEYRMPRPYAGDSALLPQISNPARYSPED